MDTGSNFSAKTPVFTGQNFAVWAVKMETYLRAFDLWEMVENDKQPTPLNNNPTVAQIKFFNEERAKKFKALTALHNAVSEEIFTRIMACKTAKEAWDKLKAEFQGDDKSRKMQVLNLKRQFEGLKMKENETIKDFSSHISKLVNQVRLLGEEFPESRIVEKVLVSLPEKFEHKICSLEDSKDFTEMSFQDLVNALQAVEQRQAFRSEGSHEEALVADFKNQNRITYKNNSGGVSRKDKGKEKVYNTWQPRQYSSNNYNARRNEKKEYYPACKYCKKTNHLEAWCWLKNIQCRNCKQFGHVQKFCKNRIENVKQAQLTYKDEDKEETLFMASVYRWTAQQRQRQR